MAWENIETKLTKALTVKVAFPAGTIWLPEGHLSIDDWLTSIAKTDEELRELNIPRIRFLQNRWPIIPLVELEWDDEFSNKRVIVAMNVGQRAYILFSDWSQYQVIAAVEPNGEPSLYRAVVGKLLENRSFIHKRPAHIKNRRPDLETEIVTVSPIEADTEGAQDRRPVFGGENFGGLGGPVDWMHPSSKPDERWKRFLTDITVGWFENWLNVPEAVYWHEDVPKSISREKKGKIVMKYKPSYGDKQREAEKRKKEEQLQSAETPTASAKKQTAEQSKTDENRPNKEDKGAA
jgi:hypothetical protein